MRGQSAMTVLAATELGELGNSAGRIEVKSLAQCRSKNEGRVQLGARLRGVLASPSASIVLFVVATGLYRFRIDVGSFGFRPEHFALVLVGAVYFVRFIRRRWRPLLARDDIPLALYLALALIVSLLNAPQPKESLRFLALMAGCVCTYLLTKYIVVEAATFRTGVIALLVAGVVEAAGGVLSWLLYPLGFDLGVQLYPTVFNTNPNAILCTFSPTGTFAESNIFGSYILPVALILTLLALAVRLRPWRRLVAFGSGVVLVGIAVSLTRSVWAAFAVGAMLILILADDRGLGTLTSLVVPFLAAGVVAFLVSNVEQPCTFVINSDRPVSLEPGAAGVQIMPPTLARITISLSLRQRLATFTDGIQDWLRHPAFGDGPNTYGQTHLTTSHRPAWISNATLMVLHDTGIVGLAILSVWFLWIGLDLVGALKRAPPSLLRTALLGLGVGFLGLLLVYQFTTALWLGFTWVYLGLIRSGTLILRLTGFSKNRVSRSASKPNGWQPLGTETNC